MAWGSLVTATTPITSTETFLPVNGIFVASAFSTIHLQIDIDYPSGNTGETTVRLYGSVGDVNSGSTDWDDNPSPLLAFSVASTTDPHARSISVNGYYAVRLGFTNSSNSNPTGIIGYRVD